MIIPLLVLSASALEVVGPSITEGVIGCANVKEDPCTRC
jgi:hypothetical protein